MASRKPFKSVCTQVAQERGFKIQLCSNARKTKLDPNDEWDDFSFEVTATKDGNPVGTVKVEDTGEEDFDGDRHVRRFYVKKSDVKAKYRGQRIGTALYEQAAKAVCQRGGTLESDYIRSSFAESFWRKQRAKGRAFCYEENWDESDKYMGEEGTPISANYYAQPWVTLTQERKDQLLRAGKIARPPYADGKWSDMELGWPCGRWKLTPQSCAKRGATDLSGVRRRKKRR